MIVWTFYPAFVATGLSVFGLTYLALRKHDVASPRTLSELATGSPRALTYFRIVLWTCGTLFAVTMYAYIIPKVQFGAFQAIAWNAIYIPELLLAAFPAKGKSRKLHNVLSTIMGGGMWASALLFTLSFDGAAFYAQLAITIVMGVLGILTFIDRKRFIFYELPFIFLSHISILVAALTLS